MLLKHRQDGFWGKGSLCVHAAIDSVRALTDGSDETASTPKIVGDVAGRSLLQIGRQTLRPPVGGLSARASFPPALHQAAGGWHPAPSYFWPEGRRPSRESLQRHLDPWWPLQTSIMLPLVPSDIFYPAQSGSPSLRVTTRSPDQITHCGGFRSGEKYKSELKARACVRAGTLPEAVSFLAEEFAGLLVDEMKPGAGEADDGRIGIGTGFIRRGLRKPMLHVGAQLRAFEKDVSAHRRE
jgi:hypothetical protein